MEKKLIWGVRVWRGREEREQMYQRSFNTLWTCCSLPRDSVCCCMSCLMSGCAAPGQPGHSRALCGHSHPSWALTSTGPATASIWTGRADPFLGLLPFLPWLSVVQKGTCTTGTSSNSSSSLDLILPLFTLTWCWLSTSGTPSVLFQAALGWVTLPKRQTSALPTPVKTLSPTPNSACQILCSSFHLLFFNFSICKTGVVTLAFSVKSCN